MKINFQVNRFSVLCLEPDKLKKFSVKSAIKFEELFTTRRKMQIVGMVGGPFSSQ